MFRLCMVFLFCLIGSNAWAQCFQGNGPELVVNGDFEQGNTGFNSLYIHCNTPSCLNEGYYSITANPTSVHNAFVGFDHTTGSGQMMVVNGAGTPNTSVWCQSVSVQPYTSYLFSAWVSTMVTSSPAVLQFSINGVILDAPYTAPSTLYTWQNFTATWCSFTDTVALICIVNQNTTFAGNDFALDDISFQPCTYQSQLAVTATPQTVCAGQSVTLAAGTGADSYAWISGSVSCNTCATVTATPLATTTYTVVGVINGCFDTVSVSVPVSAGSLVDAGSDVEACVGDTVVLTGSGGMAYAWSPATGLSNAQAASPWLQVSNTTTYTLTATDAFGCLGMDSVQVVAWPAVTAIAGPDTIVCAGNAVALFANGGTQYAWSPDVSGSGANVMAAVQLTTTFTVTVTNSSGCSDTAHVSVEIFEPVNITITSPVTVCFLDSVLLTIDGVGSATWVGPQGSCTDCSEVVFAALQSGNYTAYVVDQNGCPDTLSTSVAVLDNCASIVFPNAFTPNGDGLNDRFRPFTRSIVSIEYRVYNRWGKLIFSTNSIDDGWDGTLNGTPQPIGTYAWYAVATAVTGETLTAQGNLVLMR